MPYSIEEDFKRNDAISLYDLYGHALAKKPCPGGHDIYNLGRPILGNQTCILNLSVLCLGEEKKIFKEIMSFYYKTYMDTPLYKNPFPVGNEIYNFGRRFLRHHNYILSLSVLCLGVEKKIFQEIIYFHYMTYMATPLHKNPSPGGHEIYNFGRPFLVHNYYTRGYQKVRRLSL